MDNFKNISSYILDCIDLSPITTESLSIPKTLEAVITTAKSEKKDTYEQHGLDVAFIDWMRGIASVFDVEFRDEEQQKLLKSWKIPLGGMEVHVRFYLTILENFKKMCVIYDVNFK